MVCSRPFDRRAGFEAWRTDPSMDSFNELIRSRQSLLSGSAHAMNNSLNLLVYDSFGRHRTASCGHDYPYGSVFNVEFTPTVYTVLVAHANKAVTIYDSRLERRVMAIPNAHNDCVNIITFLDEFAFATGSDDKTIRLWDIRQCSVGKGLISVLKGHKGWVKNVEFDRRSGQLFSMAFNDGIRKWDINKGDHYISGEPDNLLFEAKEGVRMRLSPDGTTMVISLRRNHIFIVSKFDSETVSSIWNSFPPHVPLSLSDKINIAQFSENECNVPVVHRISHFTGSNYHTPLSFVFHPSSNFLAMRLLGVETLEQLVSVEETSVLYDIKIPDRPQPFYGIDANWNRFLKSCIEYSPQSALEFIKEISFSTDGRLLVSPYGESVRMLAVSTTCTPMDIYYDNRYHGKEESPGFVEVSPALCCGHQSPVLTCRLNSDNMCLVSGCYEGKVLFNWPRF